MTTTPRPEPEPLPVEPPPGPTTLPAVPATLDDLATMRRDQALVDRVTMQVQLVARWVLTEDPETPNHAAREQLARQAIANGEYWGRTMASGVAVHPEVMACAPDQTQVTDQVIEQAVLAGWDDYIMPIGPAMPMAPPPLPE